MISKNDRIEIGDLVIIYNVYDEEMDCTLGLVDHGPEFHENERYNKIFCWTGEFRYHLDVDLERIS